MDEFACSQVNVGNLCLAFGEKTLQAAFSNTDHSYFGNIALQQGIGGLGGAVGDKNHFIRLYIIFLQAFLKGIHHSFGHAFFGKVGRHNRPFSHDPVGTVVNGNSFGVSAAHIDSDSDCSFFHYSVTSLLK